MPSRLDEIVAASRRRVAAAKTTAARDALMVKAAVRHPRRFGLNLRHNDGRLAVIAELKKASPSKGLIRADFPVAELACELQDAGASALSVLTDEAYFQGSLENLDIAAGATWLPCLRKDFIVDDFQLLEARAYGASAVLLIVAALSQPELEHLHRTAGQLELGVLCEVHDDAELQRALDAGCAIIGVNNRNLHTFQVDLNTSLALAARMPAGVTKVAESGIETADDLARLRDTGFHAALIGESLMRAPRPGDALRELLTVANATTRR